MVQRGLSHYSNHTVILIPVEITCMFVDISIVNDANVKESPNDVLMTVC